jgi:hypothetical protein
MEQPVQKMLSARNDGGRLQKLLTGLEPFGKRRKEFVAHLRDEGRKAER